MFTGANANYHSLQTSLEHRFSNGFNLITNYTFGHLIDDAPCRGGCKMGSEAGPFPLLSANRRLDRGNSDIDLRQRWALMTSYQLPFGQNIEDHRAEETEMSVEEDPERTDLSFLQRTDVSLVDRTNVSTPYKEHKNRLQEVNTRSERACGDPPEVCVTSGADSLARSHPSFCETGNTHQPVPDEQLSGADLISSALSENGVKIRRPARPERLLELGRIAVPQCPPELLAAFIDDTSKTRHVEVSTFFEKAIPEDF